MKGGQQKATFRINTVSLVILLATDITGTIWRTRDMAVGQYVTLQKNKRGEALAPWAFAQIVYFYSDL